MVGRDGAKKQKAVKLVPGRRGYCGKSRTGLFRKRVEYRRMITMLLGNQPSLLTRAGIAGVDPRAIIASSIEVVAALGVGVGATSGGVQRSCVIIEEQLSDKTETHLFRLILPRTFSLSPYRHSIDSISTLPKIQAAEASYHRSNALLIEVKVSLKWTVHR